MNAVLGDGFQVALHDAPIDEETSQMSCSFALPIVTLPQKAICEAVSHGVQHGLQPLISTNLELNAAYAIALMEEVHEHGCKEKVAIFVQMNASRLCKHLNDSQAAEFLIRTAKLLQTELMLIYRDRAVDLLTGSIECAHCPIEVLVTLARLFADTGDVINAELWLKKAEASNEQCVDTVAIFFEKGLFQEGLQLLDAFNVLKIPMGEWNQLDCIILLGYGLKHQDLIKDTDYQEILLQQLGEGNKRTILLKALCHTGMVDEALRLAQLMAAKKRSIYPLLALAKSFMAHPEDYGRYLEMLRKAAVNAPNPSRAFLDIIYSKSFSISDNLETLTHLDNASGKLQALWELACGVIIKHGKSERDYQDLGGILSAMRLVLMGSTAEEVVSHPPYWVKILEECIEFGFLGEALKTGRMFKKWLRSLSEEDKKKSDALWFLSDFGVLQLAMGRIKNGRSDLKKAYKMQKEMKSKGRLANNYAHFINSTVRALAYRCPGVNFFQMHQDLIGSICRESFEPFSYRLISSRVEKWVAEVQEDKVIKSCDISKPGVLRLAEK